MGVSERRVGCGVERRRTCRTMCIGSCLSTVPSSLDGITGTFSQHGIPSPAPAPNSLG